MKLKSLPLLMMAVLATPVVAQAAEESPHKLSANVTLTSNYIFRGISQTSNGPAIQGGLDYTHSSGFYLGTWASNVDWTEDFQGYDENSMEIDFYGGYRGNIGKSDFTFDVGGIYYMYPGDNDGGFNDADTGEIYAALGWKWFTVKYSYYLTDEVFGWGDKSGGDADGSGYLAISASVPVGETGLTLGASWGTFSFEGNSAADYDDWSVSAAYDLGKLSKVTEGVTLGLKYTDTDVNDKTWTNTVSDVGEDLGDGTFTVWVTKVF